MSEQRSLRYAWFVVVILMLAYVISFVDRQILNLLVGPIRRDLAISDTQMSLLMGFSFAIFYTLCGIPLGRMADTKSRRGIVAAGLVFWSVATAACGMARQYWQLFLCRIGVGVGEAALSPAAYSMIADYFPREQRATALSVYSAGIYLGSGLAFLVGGAVIQFVSAQGEIALPLVGSTRPWQVVFFILGAIGLLFSFAFFLVREPARQGATATPAFTEVWRHLVLNRRTVLCHNLGFAMLAFCSYGSSAWIPSFFVRTYGWSITQTAYVYGTIVLIFATAGILFGGRLADRWLSRGIEDANLRVGLLAAVLLVPFSLIFPLMPSPEWAAITMILSVFCIGMPFGVAPAAIQEIMPNAMRGQASAVYLFIVNMIGLGLGPTAVAMITDYVFQDDNAVRYSLAIVGTLAAAAASLLLWAGLKPYRESIARMRASA